MKNIYLYVLICFMLYACQNNKKTSNNSIDLSRSVFINDTIFNMEIINELNDSLFVEFMTHPADSYVIVYFDADCSQCITLLLTLLNQATINENVRYLYIGNTSHDLLMIEFYLDRMKRSLSWNEYLLTDTSGYYLKYNPDIKTDILPAIVTDNRFNIIGALSLYEVEHTDFFSLLDEWTRDYEENFNNN